MDRPRGNVQTGLSLLKTNNLLPTTFNQSRAITSVE